MTYMINTFSDRLRHSCAYSIVITEKLHLKPTSVIAELQRKCAIIFTKQKHKFLLLLGVFDKLRKATIA
jgi:hypothetical protein